MADLTLTLTTLAKRLVPREVTPRERHEPHLEVDRARWKLIPTVRRVVLSEWEQRRRPWIAIIAVVSLIFHILLVTAVIYYAGRDEPQGGGGPIPVQLVMLPPDPNKPQEKPRKPPPPPPQQQQKQKPPPPGPLASDEFGDPNATGKTPSTTHAPEAGEAQRQAGEAPPPPSSAPDSQAPSDVARPKPPEPETKSAAPDQEKLPDTTDKLAVGGALQPPPSTPNKPRTEQLAAKAVDRPSDVRMLRVKPGGATRPTERPDETDHDSGHKAKYPGPDATRDEYLAYVRDLTMQQLSAIPKSLLGDNQGVAAFQVLVRPNGSIVWFASTRSTGDRQIDRVLLTTLNGMSNFPPLPGRMVNPDGSASAFEFSLPVAVLAKTL